MVWSLAYIFEALYDLHVVHVWYISADKAGVWDSSGGLVPRLHIRGSVRALLPWHQDLGREHGHVPIKVLKHGHIECKSERRNRTEKRPGSTVWWPTNPARVDCIACTDQLLTGGRFCLPVALSSQGNTASPPSGWARGQAARRVATEFNSEKFRGIDSEWFPLFRGRNCSFRGILRFT